MANKLQKKNRTDSPYNQAKPMKHPFKRIALCVVAIFTWLAGFGVAWKLMVPKFNFMDVGLMVLIGLSLLVHVSLDTEKKFRDYNL